jgi:hypothetical protein
MTEEKVWEFLAELVASQKKTDEQLAKTDAQLAKTDAKLDRIAEMLGGISNNQGKIAKTSAQIDRFSEMDDHHLEELLYRTTFKTPKTIAREFFFNLLEINPVVAGKPFEIIHSGFHASRAGIEEAYDLVLFNKDTVFIFEVNDQVRPKDIETLIHRKGGNFPLLFPQYCDFQRHLGLATFSIEDAVLEEALSRGVTVLQRRGDLIETIPAAA